ncbi:MAG: ribosomal protein [Patescibacteria group bacterium]|jgi:large subunit ribosomal protein L31|nr:ribosomal protein [Patescibacteria group bacterium]
MKTGIHPTYYTISIACACGNTFQAGSTQKEDIRVEICAKCHPLYTGKSNLIDTAGRLDKFQARQARAEELKKQATDRTKSKAEKIDTAEKTEKSDK